jgi:hypothetical protein
MAVIKTIGKLAPAAYKQMIDHLTRKKIKNPFIKAKDIVVDKKPEVEQTEMFNRFNQANPRQDMAGGGMLVQPGFGGTRQGYADKSGRETVHLVNVTGNPNHSGIYRTTNLKTGSVSYRGGYTRRGEGGRKFTKTSSTIKGARADLDKALQIPKGKSVIQLQKERGAGNLLKDEKFMNQLEKAFEEVSALEKKGYGNIDNIVKKYQKKFFVKPGSKTISGSTVQKGTDNVFTKTLATEIREYAKDLEIYNLESPSIEKALNDYRKIKNPKKGMIPNIAERYGINRATLDRYITNLNQRKYIPVKDPDEYTKAIREAEKKALKKFSDRYFERVLSAPMTSGKYFAEAGDDEVVRLQKSHLGDKLTQDVRTSNIGYAAQEINQEVLKEIDTEMRTINKQLANLYKNKPAGYKQKMDILNQQGTDLAAVSKGYKKFEAIDPDTGKKFVINFSSPGQEFDPGGVLGEDVKLADIDKQDKAFVKDLKKTAMQSATKTKKQVQADIDIIKQNLFDYTKGQSKQVKGLSAYMKENNPLIKCKLANGVNCNDPRAYQSSLNELSVKAAQGDTQAASALKNFAAKAATAGRFIKTSLGPLAIAAEFALEGGIALNTTLSEGVPFKQAFADSYINKYVFGPKIQIDKEAEIAKEMAKGEEFAMAERGRRMAPFMAQSKEADEQRQKERIQEMISLYPQYSDQQLINMLQDAGYNPQDIINQKTTTRITPAVTSTLSGLDQLRTGFQEQDALQRIATAGGVANLAGGGIAGLSGGKKSGPPPISGPTPDGDEGLPAAFKNVRKR